MGHTLISKLKPNYLDRSELKYDILIIKRRKCSINKNFSPPFSFIKKIVNSSSLSRARRKLLENLTWKNGLSVLIVAIDNGDNLLYIPKNIEKSSLSITGVDASFSKLKKTQTLLEKFIVENIIVKQFLFQNSEYSEWFHQYFVTL